MPKKEAAEISVNAILELEDKIPKDFKIIFATHNPKNQRLYLEELKKYDILI